MDPSRVKDLFLKDRGIDTDPAGAAETLVKLRDALPELEAQYCVRVSTLTCLVVIPDPVWVNYAALQVQMILKSSPARLVIVVIDKQAKGGVSCWIACGCRQGTTRSVTGEEVVFHVPGKGEEVPSLVFPLMEDDLPVFLWWVGAPVRDSSLLEALLSSSDRVILDGTTFPFVSVLPEVVALMDDPYHKDQVFSDLDWTRIEPWRERVASFFDAAASNIGPEEVEEVEIAHWCGNPEAGEISMMPLLMAAWFVERSGWRIITPLVSGQVRCERKQGSSLIRFIPTAVGEQNIQGRIWRVKLSYVNRSGQKSVFVVKRSVADPGLLSCVCSDPHLQILNGELRLDTHDLTWVWGNQFEQFTRDSVYERAVHMALDVVGFKEVAEI